MAATGYQEILVAEAEFFPRAQIGASANGMRNRSSKLIIHNFLPAKALTPSAVEELYTDIEEDLPLGRVQFRNEVSFITLDTELDHKTYIGEEYLLLAILDRAIRDCCGHIVEGGIYTGSKNQLQREAHAWIFSTSEDPWSFFWVGEQLGLGDGTIAAIKRIADHAYNSKKIPGLKKPMFISRKVSWTEF